MAVCSLQILARLGLPGLTFFDFAHFSCPRGYRNPGDRLHLSGFLPPRIPDPAEPLAERGLVNLEDFGPLRLVIPAALQPASELL